MLNRNQGVGLSNKSTPEGVENYIELATSTIITKTCAGVTEWIIAIMRAINKFDSLEPGVI